MLVIKILQASAVTHVGYEVLCAQNAASSRCFLLQISERLSIKIYQNWLTETMFYQK